MWQHPAMAAARGVRWGPEPQCWQRAGPAVPRAAWHSAHAAAALHGTVRLLPRGRVLGTRMRASHPSVHHIQMLAPYYTSAQLFFNLKG